MQRLVLSCPNPVGCAFLKESILIEPAHLRQDKSRPGDIYAMGTGLYTKDTVMGLVVTSAPQNSCLTHTSKSSDYAIRKAENEKYKKDARSTGPIQNSSTKRFVPLAMKHVGLRGGHFNASLKEFATTLVTRPSGCSVMKGPFALSVKGAVRRILNAWGAILTWTAQRQHATQALNNMVSFYSCASLLSSANQGFAARGLPRDSHARGPALLPALEPVHEPVGDASVNVFWGGRGEWLMSSAFDPGQGGVRGGVGLTLSGTVDSALSYGMMPC